MRLESCTLRRHTVRDTPPSSGLIDGVILFFLSPCPHPWSALLLNLLLHGQPAVLCLPLGLSCPSWPPGHSYGVLMPCMGIGRGDALVMTLNPCTRVGNQSVSPDKRLPVLTTFPCSTRPFSCHVLAILGAQRKLRI